MKPLVVGAELDGRYRLERMLAHGGMSEVWVARHRLLERRVALKFMRVAGADARKLLLDEAKILASLRHPAIVEVYDCGLLEGEVPYLAMELIEGESLRERIAREGPMPARVAVRMLAPIARGLHAAHERGVVHRDVKPENILCVRGEGSPVKLIDFGISRLDHGERGPIDIAGTPAYMAPEQARGERCDRRADLWALGVTLYELMTGDPPFEGGDVSATLARVLEGAVAYPRKATGLDGALWRVVMTALRVDPSQRFATAALFADALDEWLGSLTRPSRPTLVERPQPSSTARETPSHDTEPNPLSTRLDALIREKLSNS